MTESSLPCEFMIDVYGLRALCHLPALRRNLAFKILNSGRMRLLSRVWQDFTEILPDLAQDIDSGNFHKINMSAEYRDCAATIAEQANSGFVPRPYDSCSDWYTASVCRLRGYVLVTGADNVTFYERLAACAVTTINQLV
jgi:hypothetical protein